MKRIKDIINFRLVVKYVFVYAIGIMVVFGLLSLDFIMGSKGNQVAITSQGFSTIDPVLAGILLNSNGESKFVFRNKAGENIFFLGGIASTDLGGECELQLMEGSLKQIMPEENFFVIGTDCFTEEEPGDPVSLNVKIDYQIANGEIYNERGTIRGPVE
ncbi:MAG: hypothetical protein ABH950_04420 [Candidatus Altiarchaeota archaeon]